MNRPELSRQLQALAHCHPGVHPYTLALRFQVQTGRILSGQQVKQLLRKPGNNCSQAAKL
ncbi:MAG: hypothetical protein WD136_03775 [Cyanobium sp.]